MKAMRNTWKNEIFVYGVRGHFVAPSVEIARKKTCIVQRPDEVVRNAGIPFGKYESGAAVGEEYGQLKDENRILTFVCGIFSVRKMATPFS